jgi:diamine N-acetyltransferase
MNLQGEKVILRAMEPEDASLLYEWENDTKIWRVSNTIVPFSKASLSQFIANERDIYLDKQLRLIILDSSGQRPVGCLDIFDFNMRHQRAGLGILIADGKNRRKGLASDAISLVTCYAFETLLLHQLYCNIPADNKESIGLFEKHGFIKAGVKKNWIKTPEGWVDECVYQLLKE